MRTPLTRPALRLPDDAATGVGLALAAALVSGLAVYLNAYAVKALPDPAVFTTLKNGVAAAVLAAILGASGGASAIRTISRRDWAAVLAVAVIGGSVPFVLFFNGLAGASAPSAAFIQKTLFIWVAFLAVPFLGETLGLATLGALAVLLVGQALVLPPVGITWGPGEAMILAATGLWAVETVLVRRLLPRVPSHAMATLRLGLGLIVLAAYLAATGRLGLVGSVSLEQWGWVLVTGGILAGYVATWFAALRRAPATIVTSVLVLGAVVTGALTSATKGSVPSATVVAGYVLIVAGAGTLVALTRRAARAAGSQRIGTAHARSS
jgi:drug/metabolite transporter (DMT)-like permease